MEYSLKIYGASDDLIEIEGDINAEFDANSDGPYYIAISDGTLLDIHYDNDGLWRIKLLIRGLSVLDRQEGSVDKDTNDIVTLVSTKPFKWVVLGVEKVINK